MRRVTHPIDQYISIQLEPHSKCVPPPDVFIVKTCLRYELFGAGISLKDIPSECLIGFSTGWEAFERLVFICCGADSSLLGETEVFGQIKSFYREQFEQLDRRLHWFIQGVFWATKSLRSSNPIHAGPSSYGGWVRRKLLTQTDFMDSSASLLMVGAGKMISEIAHFLRHVTDPNRFHWMNRTIENAQRLQSQMGGTVLPLDFSEIVRHRYIVIALGEASTLKVDTDIWSTWRDSHGLGGMVLDLSAPPVVPKEKTCDRAFTTLDELKQLSEMELHRRTEKQRHLREQIHTWVSSHWTSNFLQAVRI